MTAPAKAPMTSHTYTEFGIMISAGPDRGTFIETFRSLEAAQQWLGNQFAGDPSAPVPGLEIRCREVSKGEWRLP